LLTIPEQGADADWINTAAASRQTRGNATMANIKWQYPEHWRVPSPRGPVSHYTSPQHMDAFIKQLVTVGFAGLGIFVWNLQALNSMFGSVKAYKNFIQDRGMEKIVDIFWAAPQAAPNVMPHDRASHDAIFSTLERFVGACDGLEVENLVVMPTNTHYGMEPITPDRLKITADLWNRVGKMTRSHGMKLGCHHEFWGGIRTPEQIDFFYANTDPEYVHLYLDTAQHQIASVDPVALYIKYHDRVCGFHLKDTHYVDLVGDYRRKPEPELCASTTGRWFHEMGTPEGLVDFPALMAALKEYGYKGWLGAEHDKAQIGGGSYPESTAIAMWYVRNVLSPIYS
jgi:sugar phosphate isomerase/epimerase